jgi:hypothetical protein
MSRTPAITLAWAAWAARRRPSSDRWGADLLILGIDNKLVKQPGSDYPGAWAERNDVEE